MNVFRGKDSMHTSTQALRKCYSFIKSSFNLRLITRLSLVIAMAIGVHNTTAFALELSPEEIRGEKTNRPVSVLQNRFFKKVLRPELGILAGQVNDEAYLETKYTGARLGLFFTEQIGLEYQFIKTKVSDSLDRKALRNIKYLPYPLPTEEEDPNFDPATQYKEVSPEINPIRRAHDLTAVYAPIYGKLDLLNAYILYFDLYISLGLSKVDTDQGEKSAFTFGIGERFYFSESWSIRVDYKRRMYDETRDGKTVNKDADTIDLGLSFFFL